MKKYLVGSLLILSSNAFASNTMMPGAYDCKGQELGTNTPYTCKMTITKTGETLASTATCSDGNSYRGTGIYDEKAKLLATVFINPKKAEETGVCMSQMTKDKNLVSTWTYLDKTSVSHTTCHKI